MIEKLLEQLDTQNCEAGGRVREVEGTLNDLRREIIKAMPREMVDRDLGDVPRFFSIAGELEGKGVDEIEEVLRRLCPTPPGCRRPGCAGFLVFQERQSEKIRDERYLDSNLYKENWWCPSCREVFTRSFTWGTAEF